MSSNTLFLNDGLKDIHSVGHSVMKTVDAVAFKKRKALQEDNNDESDNFEMKILDEGVLDKALEGHERI